VRCDIDHPDTILNGYLCPDVQQFNEMPALLKREAGHFVAYLLGKGEHCD
jgi:hypothetical protein